VKKLNQGFTLFEIIVAMTIFSILSLGIFQFIGNTEQVSNTISLATTTQEDLRDAAAIITDEVQRAYYVFPPCGAYSVKNFTAYSCDTASPTNPFDSSIYVPGKLNITFSRFTLASSGGTTLRPNSTSDTSKIWTWEVGKTSAAPILAMIVAPRDPTISCTSASTSDKQKACYYFVAYYPVLRSSVSRTSLTDTSKDASAGSAEKLDYSPSNKDQWVLMEYREILDDNLHASTSTDYDKLLVNVDVSGIGKVNFPGITWDYVGCVYKSSCESITMGSGATTVTTDYYPPSTDPRNTIQSTEGNIPSLYKATSDPYFLARFTARMNLTTTKFGNGEANILAPNIEPLNGFQVDYANSDIDERGVTNVRILLQMGVSQGSRKTVFPSQPLEIFASPRNLPPGYSGQ
jgi:prepilin-type N-terminal cleavage/methylation domain-containing protein